MVGDETTVTLRSYDKKCIALAQLESALRLYGSRDSHEDLLSVITLAGAAEEILGKLIERRGKNNALDSLKATTAAVYKYLFPGDVMDDKILKRSADRANRARNALKHLDAGGNPTVELDLPQEAVDILTRAIDNYWLLEESLTPAMGEFERAQRAGPALPDE